MKLSGTIATHCTCVDEEGNEAYNENCYGDCFEYAIEDFAMVVEPLFLDTNHFKISGIRLWSGTVGGIAKCISARELVRAMSVDGEFILRWEFDDETNSLGARLSHHDNPMGSWVTVEPVDEDIHV